MEKTLLQIMMDNTCDKLHDRLNHLLSFDASKMDCEDVNEIHHIWEVIQIIHNLKR